MDYEKKTINELMGIYNPIFEAREDAMTADYNELFCVWMYDLITDIEDSEPEPKYALGQQVWVIHPTKRQPWIDEVIGIKVRVDGFQYVLPTYAFYEWDVYPTRKALIEAQLWYWTKFLADEMHKPKASCCSVHAGGYEECAREDETKDFIDSYINNMFQDENASKKIDEMFVCNDEAQNKQDIISDYRYGVKYDLNNLPTYNNVTMGYGGACACPNDTHKEPEECVHVYGYGGGTLECIKCSKDLSQKLKECEHEPDFKAGHHPTMQKCKKCGEFYR